MKRFAILSVLLFVSISAYAQVEFGERYEQKHEWLNDSYLVVSNEEDGVLLVQADYNASSKEYPLYFKHLNTNLEKIWEDSVSIKQRFFIKGYFYGEKNTYVMLQNNRLTSIKVLRIDALNKKIDEFESKEIAELDITEFEVVKNTAVIGGYFEERPVVFAYDLENNKVKTLQNVYQNQSELLEVRINNDSLTFNVLASVMDDNKERTVMVNTYDYAGNAIRDYRLITKPDYELVNGVSSSINDITQVVVGMYGYRTDHTVSGIYVNHVDRTGAQTMNYYNFGELPKFLDYMGEKRATKQKAKAKSLKDAGKEHRYRAEVFFRELIEEDDKLILVGEFYKLYTNNNTNNANRFAQFRRYGNAGLDNFYNTYNNFNSGNRLSENDFTHAYALVLDQNGEIQWDDYMEVDEEIEGSLNELGRFQWLGDKASYMYYKDTELFLKVMDGTDKNEMLTTELKLLEEGDDIRQERDESLGSVRWYDNNYLVYGIHHIRPADKSKSVRKVFFINKVSVTNTPTASRLD